MTLRSSAWFADATKLGFIHRSHLHQEGFPADAYDGSRPVVGIANTWSELTPCNTNLRDLADSVKRGVWEAGGLPLEFPVVSLGEPYLRPSSMLYRNLLAIEAEEMLRANPLDAAVLLGGCDKTVPGLMMGAASADLPSIVLTSGPMLDGRFRGQPIGSGTDIWRFSEDVRAGRMTTGDFAEAEACMSRSPGHCMTMGTASTMACMAEALGMMPPDGACLPAVDAGRRALAQRIGRRAVGLVLGGERLAPSALLTRSAFENAVRVNAAIGGSTNAVLHLLALAGRVGVDLTLDDIDRLGRDVPLLVDLKPSGRFLMDAFAAAGGLQVVIRQLLSAGLVDGDALSVTGSTLAEQCATATSWDEEVIRPLDRPVLASAPTAVLRGNLAPDGAVLKVSAASPHLLKHRGPALVFDAIEEYLAVAGDPALDVTADTVLIVRNLGPVGYPGMPEVGNLPLPARLGRAGVSDMVRISDARMSGTAYGTVVLHVAPEAAVGGPLALVRTGDAIRLDVESRSLELEVDAAELARRAAAWTPPVCPGPVDRGWVRLYREHVLQADRGCDLDFLVGASGHAVPRPPF